jgi:hypothetical protein
MKQFPKAWEKAVKLLRRSGAAEGRKSTRS